MIPLKNCNLLEASSLNDVSQNDLYLDIKDNFVFSFKAVELRVTLVKSRDPISFSTVLIQLVRNAMFSRSAFFTSVSFDNLLIRCQKLINSLKAFKESGNSPGEATDYKEEISYLEK